MFSQKVSQKRSFSAATSGSLLLAAVIALTQAPSTALAQKAGQGARNPAQAQQPAPQQNSQAESEKLDVSDIERKYWAAKDSDFTVVQNRLFSKANRWALSLGYGMLINESWADGPTYSAKLNRYFSERYGAELSFSSTDSADNKATERLSTQGGKPNHGQIKNFYGVAFNWIPFYAKMSLLDYKILYFDMSISPGVGIMQYEQQREEGGTMKTAPALTLDVTQHFFLNKWVALRFDYKNRWFQEEVVWYKQSSVPAGQSRTVGDDLHHVSMLMFGLTLYY